MLELCSESQASRAHLRREESACSLAAVVCSMHTISRLGSSTALRGSPLTVVSQSSACSRLHNASALGASSTAGAAVKANADRPSGHPQRQSSLGRTLSLLAASTLAAGVWLVRVQAPPTQHHVLQSPSQLACCRAVQ